MSATPIPLIEREQFESGYWETAVLSLRFRPDGFDGAGALCAISDASQKVILGLAYDRLAHAYVEHKWLRSNRVIVTRHYLGEDLEALSRFLQEVLPHLEVCFLGSEVNYRDPRLQDPIQGNERKSA